MQTAASSLSAQHLDDGDPNWNRRESSADISAVPSSVGDPFPVALMTSAAESCGDGQFALLFGKSLPDRLMMTTTLPLTRKCSKCTLSVHAFLTTMKPQMVKPSL